MNTREFETPQATSGDGLSGGGSSEPVQEMRGVQSVRPANTEGRVAGKVIKDKAEAEHEEQAHARLEGLDATKLQRAIENLVGRIAEARSHGATGAHARSRETQPDTDFRPQVVPGTPPEIAMSAQHRNDSGMPQRVGAPETERQRAALELRMRQIAEIAGAPIVENIGADIAALRGGMDRLSEAGGILSNRVETIQRQLSNLRESVDSSNVPVVERLVELKTRLDEIGEALAKRHLSLEARAAVEHSCGHILGAITRIEGLARQTVVPEGMWDQIAGVGAKIDRLATFDEMSGLERKIQEVSEDLGNLAEHSARPEDLANLERRLTQIGAATKALVEEIRERPAYDPGDVRALLEKIENWRRELPRSDSHTVADKLDTLARQVDELPKLEHLAPLSRIQDELRDLTGFVSAQRASISGIELAGLQDRLARVCDELTALRGGSSARFRDRTDEHLQSTAMHLAYEDDEDQKLAEQMAIRFAPESIPEDQDNTESSDPGLDPESEDVVGAFDAVQSALEALVGQIPFIERTWDTGGRSPASGNASISLTGDSAQYDHPGANELLRRPSHGAYGTATSPGSPAVATKASAGSTDASANAASLDASEADPGDAGPQGEGTTKDVADSVGKHPACEDPAQHIDSYSTWRKAKVAVIAATPWKS